MMSLKRFQFYFSFQITSFDFIDFLYFFSPYSSSLIFALIFIISFVLLTFSIICFCFSGFLRWKLRSLTWNFSSFQAQAFSATNFILSKGLAAFQNFWYFVLSFSFSLKQFLIFLCFFPPLSTELNGSTWFNS